MLISVLLIYLFLGANITNFSCGENRSDRVFVSSNEISNVCVVDEGHVPKDATTRVATELSIPLFSMQNDGLAIYDCAVGFTHALTIRPYQLGNFKDYALGIHAIKSTFKFESPSKKKDSFIRSQPLIVDFYPPSSSRVGRRSKSKLGPDLLIKAVAPRKGIEEGAVVYDLTAGLGQDALIIARSGAKKVVMVERDPIVAALLEDGLRRLNLIAKQSPSLDETAMAVNLTTILSLEKGDGRQVIEYVTGTGERPDIVYLDPMFPVRTKRSLVKKNMQILHGLLQSQIISDTQRQEEAQLLETALQAARLRVVIKRPLYSSPVLSENVRSTFYSFKGSVNRWDVYPKVKQASSEVLNSLDTRVGNRNRKRK